MNPVHVGRVTPLNPDAPNEFAYMNNNAVSDSRPTSYQASRAGVETPNQNTSATGRLDVTYAQQSAFEEERSEFNSTGLAYSTDLWDLHTLMLKTKQKRIVFP